MVQEKVIICPICEKVLDDEESERPRIEPTGNKRIICDNCYWEKYMEICVICENSIDHNDQTHIVLPGGDDRGLSPGVYQILGFPYYLTDCLGSFEVIPERVKFISNVPNRWQVESEGYVCSECRKKAGAI